MRPSEPLNLGPSPFPRKGKRLHRQLFITLLLTAAHLGAQPADEDPREALVAMGEAITRVQHYRASIERVASLEVAGESNSVQTFASLELEKPNRITFITDNPEGTFEVRSDGEWLTVTVPGSGEILREPAPATMAEIDAATGGLATEGLALASLHMVSDPVAALTEEYSQIRFVGRSAIEGRPCHVIGLESPENLGPRLLLYIADDTHLPMFTVLDASSHMREALTARGQDNRNARLTVSESHRNVTVEFRPAP